MSVALLKEKMQKQNQNKNTRGKRTKFSWCENEEKEEFKTFLSETGRQLYRTRISQSTMVHNMPCIWNKNIFLSGITWTKIRFRITLMVISYILFRRLLE